MPSEAADRLFDQSFRAALLQFLAERPNNTAAQEAKRFVESTPELRFRCPTDEDSAALQVVSAAAVYYGRTRTILISGNTLRKGGIEPDYARWSIQPSEYRRAIRLIAPILIHELRHAQIHRELGIDAPVKENELLAYAAQARYIAQEPDLATQENFGAGMKALKEYIPLLNEKASLSAQETELSYARDAQTDPVKQAQIADQLRELRERIAALEEQLTRRGWVLSETDLDEYRIWAAFASGWETFDRSFDYLGKASVFSDAELTDFVFRMKRAVRSGGSASRDSAPREDLLAAAAAVETFSDPAKVRAARAYFQDRIERLRPLAGRGFEQVSAVSSDSSSAPAQSQSPKPAAPHWLILVCTALGFVAGLWGTHRASRRAGLAKADPEMTDYLRRHAERFGIEALRDRLLSEGHPRELVEASVEAALRP